MRLIMRTLMAPASVSLRFSLPPSTTSFDGW